MINMTNIVASIVIRDLYPCHTGSLIFVRLIFMHTEEYFIQC